MLTKMTVDQIESKIEANRLESVARYEDQRKRNVSFDDSWLSNNAHRSNTDKLKMELELAQNNWMEEFPILCDLDGNKVDLVKEVDSQFGVRLLVKHNGETKFMPRYYPSDSARKLANMAKVGFKFVEMDVECEVICHSTMVGQFQQIVAPVGGFQIKRV
jgi:hypothetical protein